MNFPQEHIAILSEILNRHIYKPGLCSQKVSKIAGVAKDAHILTWNIHEKDPYKYVCNFSNSQGKISGHTSKVTSKVTSKNTSKKIQWAHLVGTLVVTLSGHVSGHFHSHPASQPASLVGSGWLCLANWLTGWLADTC